LKPLDSHADLGQRNERNGGYPTVKSLRNLDFEGQWRGRQTSVPTAEDLVIEHHPTNLPAYVVGAFGHRGASLSTGVFNIKVVDGTLLLRQPQPAYEDQQSGAFGQIQI